MKSIFLISFFTFVCCASLFAEQKPQTFTLQEIMQSIKSTSTITAPPTQEIPTENISVEKSTEPLSEATISKKVKLAINQLGSTSASNEQTMAKNNLIRIGKPAVAQLSNALINDKRTWTRCQIARVLGKIGDNSAIAALEQASSTKFDALNRASIESLGEIGGSKSVAALEKIKASNTDTTLSKTIEDSIIKAKLKEK